jgi:hypothetical protein
VFFDTIFFGSTWTSKDIVPTLGSEWVFDGSTSTLSSFASSGSSRTSNLLLEGMDGQTEIFLWSMAPWIVASYAFWIHV